MRNHNKQPCSNIEKVFPRPTKDISKRLSRITDEYPELWQKAIILAEKTREMLIRRISPNNFAETSSEIENLVELMRSESGSILELLCCENCVNSFLRLNEIERLSIAATSGKTSKSHFMFWENVLTLAQRRFLRALESLAKLKKLARTTPSFQINIATDGGRQINVTQETTRSVGDAQ